MRMESEIVELAEDGDRGIVFHSNFSQRLAFLDYIVFLLVPKWRVDGFHNVYLEFWVHVVVTSIYEFCRHGIGPVDRSVFVQKRM